eukprot:Sspe_Gene.78272::Locus_48968_Transcript_2_2_Confidence_0.667_Length_2564::g.78272::m.78272/K00232/E1.3.3.6, ACOX1, ACOX3; acyl-CoA oxidase
MPTVAVADKVTIRLGSGPVEITGNFPAPAPPPPPAAPVSPPPPPPPAVPQREEGKGDHSFKIPKDMQPLRPSEEQSWISGGTAHILPAERKKATFEVDRLTEALYGGPEMVKRRRFILAPSKRNKMDELEKYNTDREGLMAAHFKHFIAIHKSFTQKGYRPTTEETGWMGACSMHSGTLTTHMGLFLPTLVAQSNSAQQLQWLPRTMKFQIIGAYAQTELGHGSNVRGLQTVAEYVPEEQCFVVNTPTLQSMKFWNSGVGCAATHCTLYAQLVIKGKEYGVHVFFMQLRDENHQPLPGIEIGDCGNKLGDNGIDCGYIRLKNVRVPREHLLGKKAHVEPDGTYVKHVQEKGTDSKAAEKLSYMTMLTARSNMIGMAGGKLAIAATTAVRYSCVRHQGFIDTAAGQTFTAPEKQIIDYQVQSYRLLKQVAMSYAIQFAAKWIMMRFNQLAKGLWKLPMEDDDDEKEQPAAPEDEGADLPEIHASSAGLKGLCCRLAADGMEDCRKCCGGHGYLLASGIAATWSDYVWQATAEGDMVVMLLQTARFLLKSLDAARNGERLSGIMEYLEPFRQAGYDPLRNNPPPARNAGQLADLAYLAHLLRHRAMVAIATAAQRLEERKRAGATQDAAWQACSTSLVNAAERHCYYFMFVKFADMVQCVDDAPTRAVVARLCALYGLSQVVDGNGWAGIIDGQTASYAEDSVRDLLLALRPDAVAIVDAFDIPDRVLNSALGRYDGNVYEALYEHARDAPLNTTGPFKGFTEYVKPHLDHKFLELRGDAPRALKNSMKPRRKAKL